VLLVVDAMTGQDAVTVADKFNQAVGIDAVVLTKMDGDSRGGAALSVRHVTGRPIAFVGVGEKTDALEPFHPDRLASRILGMGDVLSLVEKAQAAVDQTKADALAIVVFGAFAISLRTLLDGCVPFLNHSGTLARSIDTVGGSVSGL